MKIFGLSTILALSASLVAGSPTEIGKRDVWAPTVLFPHSGTLWVVGRRHKVSWSTANPPPRITNPNGRIVLARGGRFVSGPGGLDDPIAAGFDLHVGRVEFQVPNVTAGRDYTVVLFGDSGNHSQQFTIRQ